MNEKTFIIKSWNDNALAWTRAVRSHALESRRLVTDKAILDSVLNIGGHRVLDVGCGEGWLARELVRAGRHVTGFDASGELIRQAEGSCKANFLVLSYDEFIASPGRAGTDHDAAVCNFSLLEEDVIPLLGAIRSVVKPGGHLIIQTLHPLTMAAELEYEDGWREETFAGLPGTWSPMPYYFRTVGSWVRALKSSGWQIADCFEPLHPSTGKPASLIFDAITS